MAPSSSMYWLTLFLGLSVSSKASAATPTVTVSKGEIQGVACKNGGANRFLSIPYAQPPVGPLRFAPPQAFNGSFNGTLVATTPAPSCLQFGLPGSSFIEPGPQSEDCLLLNVYAPSNATNSSSLPVKVWLYGGGNESGGISDPLYDGCDLATDAILVSVNYRVGPLGWLALNSADLKANNGLRDQLLALQWVQDNIAAFGGDPSKVLLFGQSAGSIDTYVIGTLPQAKSLVKGIISESGGGRDIPTVAYVQPFITSFVTALNCSITDASCIQSKSAADLNSTFNNLPSVQTPSVDTWLQPNFQFWGPTVDCDVIPAQPSQVGVQVPAVFGSNTFDGSLFVLGQYASSVTNLTSSDYDTFLTDNFGSLAPTINSSFPLSLFSSAPLPVFFAMSSVITDYAYKCPAHRGALVASQHGVPVYTYGFNHTPSCSWEPTIPPQVLALLGATHTAEIPFVFGNVAQLPLPDGNCSFNAAEKAISAQLIRSWTAMAAAGAPNTSEVQWPLFTANATRGVIVNATDVFVGAVDYSVCEQLWNKIDARILQSALNGTTGTCSSGQSHNGAVALHFGLVGTLLVAGIVAVLA